MCSPMQPVAFAADLLLRVVVSSAAGRKVAIDASMCMYQFLIAVTRAEGSHLTDAEGDTTRSPDCHVMLHAHL